MTRAPRDRLNRRRAVWAALGAGAVFFFALLPIVLMNYDAVELSGPRRFHTRAGYDHTLYHMPVIRSFASQWPTPDVSDYASATTPGYHLLMAAVLRALDDERAVRAASALIGALLAGLMVFALARARGAAWGVTRALPLICSLYVVSSAAWALPDNAAWALVLAILLIVLRPRLRLDALALAGVTLAALVLMRQIHLWAAAPIWAAWWLGESAGDGPEPRLLPTRDDPMARKAARAAIALLATLPAFLVVAWFVKLWGGTTPPEFTDRLSGPNLVVPATILTVLAMVGAFYAGDWLPGAWRALRERTGARIAVAASLPIGLALGLIAPSSYHHEDRISHIWNVVRRLPTLADRSPVIVLGSVAGAMTAALIFSAMRLRDRWIMLSVLVSFAAAQSAGALAWPRYAEALVIMWVALACARMERADVGGMIAPVRWAHAARTPLVLGLALVQLAVTAMSLKP